MEKNWFKARRLQLDLSQGDLVYAFAQLNVKLTASAISGWERGQVPNIDLVDSIASVYQATAGDVLAAMHGMSRARTAAASAG